MNLVCNWLDGMSFDAVIGDHHLVMDSKPEHGGENRGPSPKQAVLAGVCGCTGMDVVSILKKMRQPLANLSIDAEASQTQGQYPTVFEKILLNYRFTGEGLLPEKVIEAVRLSQTKYCGVSAMISKSAEIRYSVFVNDSLVAEDRAHF